MEQQCLYRRILGERFEALPEVLRRFHDAPGGGRAGGTFRVVRAPGWHRHALATLAGLPGAGVDVPVQLQIVIEGDRERWVRTFRGRPMVSVQWAQNGLLMERAGPVAFACGLVIEGARLTFDFQAAWMAGVRLPRRLAPFVESYVEAGEKGWWVLVRVFVPLVGELISYEGWIEPE